MNIDKRNTTVAALILALTGCSNENRPETMPGGLSAAEGTTGSTGANPAGESASGDADDGGGVSDADDGGDASDADDGGAESGMTKWDLGRIPDANTNTESGSGCEKVDFLFVVDNSGSMANNQQNLVANFPNFIDGVQSNLSNVDSYQLGVITTDAYVFNDQSCAEQLGSLATRTGGGSSSNMTCGPYADGGNYMTEADDLGVAFACAAQVGVDGSSRERPMQAAEIAVTKALNVPGGCNEGFIRDDALLVLVIITDEWDGPDDADCDFATDDGCSSLGNASTWFETIVDAKGGNPENVVVLSLVHFDPACPPSFDAMLSGDIESFTTMFEANGFLGCIRNDYGPLFAEATGIISDACDNFTPPG